MSSLLFPYTLPGIQFDYIRRYVPSTGVQQAMSGKTSTIAYRAYPLVHFEYAFEFLRDYNGPPADLQALVGLINAVQGRFDSFLHSDPDFNTVTAQPFGTGNATAGPFQLVATYQNVGGPGQPELVQNLNGTPTLYDNGTLIPSANYSIGATGLVTFGAGHFPAAGHALTWSGSFYYRCRFDEDHYDFKKFMNRLWSVDKITFTSITL